MKKFFSIIIITVGVWFIILSFMIVCAYAEFTRDCNIKEWGKDPFISILDLRKKNQQSEIVIDEKDREEYIKKKIEREVKELKLTGILKGEPDTVIINGDIYEEKGFVNGKEIIEVGDDYIVLRQRDYIFKVKIQE